MRCSSLGMLMSLVVLCMLMSDPVSIVVSPVLYKIFYGLAGFGTLLHLVEYYY